MPSPRPQTLPVFLLVRTAYQLLWRHRDDALRLAFIPTLVCFGALAYGQDTVVSVGEQLQAGTRDQISSGDSITVMLTALVTLLAALVLIANWLRFTLLGPMGAIGLGLNLGRPQIAYVVSMIALGFASGIGLTVICMPLLFLPQVLESIGVVIAFIAVLVVLARLLPFVVGQAIGQPISLQQSWNASRANGISLVISLILVQIPAWIAMVVVTNLLGAIGFASVAPLAMLFIISVFQSVAAILHAIVLATAFRQMIGIRV